VAKETNNPDDLDARSSRICAITTSQGEESHVIATKSGLLILHHHALTISFHGKAIITALPSRGR
jgi:hypothetical protein